MRAGPALLLLTGALAVSVLFVAGAGPASAHVGGEVAGSDFDGRVTAVTPPVPGVRVRVLQFGDQLEVVNTSAAEVEVPGYSDEPYLRIGPDGVWRNANSPATYLNLDRYGRAGIPDSASSTAAPDWVRVSTESSYSWHDHRTHWMSEGRLPPVVAADPGSPHVVSQWTVPMARDGVAFAVAGELTWAPPPAPEVVWPAHLLVALAALAAGLWARNARPLAGFLLVGGLAALAHALATPAPAVNVGSQGGAIVAALLPALVALLVAVGGARAAWRGRGVVAGWCAVVLGWLLLVQGLPDVDVLWSAHVLTAGPEWLGRIAVGLLLAVGLGLVPGGIAAVRRFRERADAAPPATPSPA